MWNWKENDAIVATVEEKKKKQTIWDNVKGIFNNSSTNLNKPSSLNQ